MTCTVLGIAGAGRSGSTLLELMLGEATGAVCAGEVTHLWGRGLVENQLCGCGVGFRECAFWQGVLADVFAREGVPDGADLRDRREDLMTLRRIPALASGKGPGQPEYSEVMGRLYQAVAERAGVKTVIDSSKYPPEAFFLAGLPGVDVVLVQLVRDSRAVVHSWQRHRVRPEIHWKQEEMPRYPTLKVAVAWVVFNRLIERARKRVARSILVRYEDLVASPRATLAAIADIAGLELRHEGSLETLTLHGNHTVSGNPLRFKRGEITVRNDAEWEEGMKPGARLLTNLVTGPWLHRYGYPIRPHRPRRSGSTAPPADPGRR